MSALRILIVSGIFPPDIGGPANYVPKIATALLQRGHCVRVVTLSDVEPDHGEPHPFPVDRINRRQAKLIRMVRTVLHIARAGLRSDVLYLNGLVLEGIVASLLCFKPVVTKVVGDLMWERAQARGRTETLDAFQSARLPTVWRLLRILQSFYMRGSARIITPSQYLKRIVTGWGIRDTRIDVIYNAVDAAGDVEGSHAEMVVPTPFDIVTVGRLVPWKGMDALIRISVRRGWRLLVIGDGPLRAALGEQARTLGAHVTFAGSLPQRDVAARMREARVFVLNSSYEGLPHIVLEAMQAGVAVIATAAGGTPECVDHGVDGVLVPPGNDERLEAAIAQVLSDDTMRQRLVAAARLRLKTSFSFEGMVDRTEGALRSVAKRP